MSTGFGIMLFLFLCRQVLSYSFAVLWTIACKAPLSMEFPKQAYSGRLPFASSGDLPNLEIEPASATLADQFFPTEPPGKPGIT